MCSFSSSVATIDEDFYMVIFCSAFDSCFYICMCLKLSYKLGLNEEFCSSFIANLIKRSSCWKALGYAVKISENFHLSFCLIVENP